MSEVRKIAGRLRYFRRVWSNITSDPFILHCISGYNIIFHTIPVQTAKPKHSSVNATLTQAAITELLQLGAIEACEPCEGQFLSPYFLVLKPNGEQRFVLNLKQLNNYVSTQHFKMEDIRTAAKLVNHDCFMGQLDLQKAYYLIPVAKASRKFLRFKWRHRLFEFVCLPFGLNVAPWLFTKLLKPVVNHLRSKGLLSVVYLDDWLCVGKSYSECLFNIQITQKTLESLGFLINIRKSILIPRTYCQFLGIIINSSTQTLELPETKRNHILSFVNRLLTLINCSIREFAKFAGTISSSLPGC